MSSSGFRVGRGGRLFLGIRPPADRFVFFWDIHFWLTDLRIFLKAPLEPIFAYFKGGTRAEKRDFSVDIFQKVPKNAFLAFFKICLRRRTFYQIKVFIVVWESSEKQFGRPKKKVDKIFKFFSENPPPTRQISRSAPVQGFDLTNVQSGCSNFWGKKRRNILAVIFFFIQINFFGWKNSFKTDKNYKTSIKISVSLSSNKIILPVILFCQVFGVKNFVYDAESAKRKIWAWQKCQNVPNWNAVTIGTK